MKAAKPKPPERPRPVVNVCRYCGDRWATWPPMLPKGWVRDPVTGKLTCRGCKP